MSGERKRMFFITPSFRPVGGVVKIFDYANHARALELWGTARYWKWILGVTPDPDEDAALLAGLVLSVGDALATLIGKPLGRHELLPGKSLEGSLAFLAGSLLVCLFFTAPHLALAASLGGLLGELLPGLPHLRVLASRGLLNDNLTIPILAGLAAWPLMLA